MGEAASSRLQTRLLSPLSLSLESTRRQVPFPNLIRVRRPGGQSVICLLLGSQPPLRFSCGPPLSAPVSFPVPLLYPTLSSLFSLGNLCPFCGPSLLFLQRPDRPMLCQWKSTSQVRAVVSILHSLETLSPL